MPKKDVTIINSDYEKIKIKELFDIAMSQVHDKKRAEAMVQAYIKGTVDIGIIRSKCKKE